MSPYSVMLRLSGLSLAEAAEFHDVRLDTLKSWSSGRRPAPEGAVRELHALLARQMRAAQEAAAQTKKLAKKRLPEEVELGLASDDHEAQSLGWLCVSAQATVIGMLLALLPADLAQRVVIVPRGASAATALAADQH